MEKISDVPGQVEPGSPSIDVKQGLLIASAGQVLDPVDELLPGGLADVALDLSQGSVIVQVGGEVLGPHRSHQLGLTLFK